MVPFSAFPPLPRLNFCRPPPGIYDNPAEYVNFVVVDDEEEEESGKAEDGEREKGCRRGTDSEFTIDMKCCVCMDAFREARLHTCNHVSMCMDCAEIGKKEHRVTRKGMVRTVDDYWCPICRKFSGRMSKVYFS